MVRVCYLHLARVGCRTFNGDRGMLSIGGGKLDLALGRLAGVSRNRHYFEVWQFSPIGVLSAEHMSGAGEGGCGDLAPVPPSLRCLRESTGLGSGRSLRDCVATKVRIR